jgi:hypothetical protein
VAKTVDGRPLFYYASWSTPLDPGNPGDISAFFMPGLLKTKDGQCSAWGGLLFHAILVQGVDISLKGAMKGVGIVRFSPTARLGRIGMLIKPWTFVGAGNNNTMRHVTYRWVSALGSEKGGDIRYPGTTADPLTRYDIVSTPGVTYGGSPVGPLLAQNNPNPFASFSNHIVVKIGGQYYDPSYGQIYNTKPDFQRTAVAGFFLVDKLPDDTSVLFARQLAAAAPDQIEEKPIFPAPRQ